MKWSEIKHRLLYHGTSMTGLVWIADSDMLVNNGGEDQVSFSRNPEVSRHFGPRTVDLHRWGQLSLTDVDHEHIFNRTPLEDGQWLAYRAEQAGGGQGVVIVVDWNKLAQDYETEAVDFGDGADGEEEEAVFRDVAPLSKYMVGLQIDQAGFAKYCEVIMAEGSDADRARVQKAMEWVRRYA